MLSLFVLLLLSTAAKADDYNPVNPPEPGVNFTLTTRCEPQDGGYSLTQSGTHAFGSSIYLSVSPNTGYRFVGWKDEEGNLLSTSTSFSYIMPSKDVTVTAHFVYDPSSPTEPSTPVFKDETQISFALNPADGGYFSSNYNGTYEVRTSHSFLVNTNTGYHFINWTRDGEVVGTSTTLNYKVPNGDHTLVANFQYDPSNPAEPGEQHFYRRLTLLSNMPEAATLYGAGTYLDGTSQRIYMSVNQYYTFVNWTNEDGEVVSENSEFYLTMPNRHVTLTANFTYNYNPGSPGEPGTPDPDGSVAKNMVAWPRMGMYDDTHVMILCETPGSTIHYTLDGSDPTKASPVFTEPVYVGSNLLVKAIAYKDGMEDSPIVSYQVTAYHASVPVYTFENKMMKITSDTPDAIIRYTLDFTEPNEGSEVYTAPFVPEENCRIKAYASKEGLTDSPVSIYVYRRAEHTLPAPTFSLNDDGKLVITPPVSGGVTRYTTDGTEPNESSNVYNGPITLTHNGTVKAYTTHINYFDSPVASYEVTNFSNDIPVITFEDRKIKITCLTEDAVIRYTLDGSDPNAGSTVYTAPFLPESDCTVKAYASQEGMNDSPVTSYEYRRAEHTLPAPSFVLDNEKRLMIVPAVSDCMTRYTMDGSVPNLNSAIYSEPIELPDSGTVRAYSTLDNYFDSPVAEFIISEHRETSPTIMPDFRNRLLSITQSESLRVALTIDGETQVVATPYTMEVTMQMSQLSAITFTEDADRLHSLPQTFTIRFHSTPLMESDGHTVYAHIDEEDEPAPENAEVWLYLDEEESGIGSLISRFEIPGFGYATAHVESDYAFRSDDALMVINAFNTGRKAGVMDDHRLSEVFGTWGDNAEDYKYLEVVGDVAREDLQFLATLPELTTLHFDTNSFESGNYNGVLANSGIEAIFSRNYPQGMLKGMKRLTTVMWGDSDSKMPEGRITEAGNPNILVWVADRDNAPSDARNVVVWKNPNNEILSDSAADYITGEAEAISLRAGYPFNAYHPLEAKGVELIKEFDQPTVIGECQGWETIALPFTPEKILRENGDEIIPFSAWPGTDDAPRPFWLYTADGSDWQPASWIEVGQPYIISMPNNPEYIYDYNIMGEVGFMASNVKLGTDDSAPRTTKWKESMLFNATFMPVEYEDGMLSLNTQGEGNGVRGSIFTDEAETLPSGAYVPGAGSSRRVPVVGGSGIELPAVSTTGLTVDSPASGTVRISSLSDRSVTITAITGVTVAKVDVRAGESVRVDGLAKGIYIVAGIKIIVK